MPLPSLLHYNCTHYYYTYIKSQVKLVLAAAMWNRPHLLVLDEPTNYLDREALGALTIGIKEFGGSVIMISHNQEFLDAICNETWLLEGGRLYTKGEVSCCCYYYF
jgi:elongation factor 3